MKMRLSGPVFLILCVFHPIFASSQSKIFPCSDPKIQEAKSNELQQIYRSDQADRKELMTYSEWPQELVKKMGRKDLKRREAVAKIFAAGCFSSAADYAAAAMVFQHGTVPDHFYQAFIWSKRGVDLGDLKQKDLMALAIDRYLVNIGQKQLFGSQFFKLSSDTCWCLQPVEDEFPDAMRFDYTGKTKDDEIKVLATLNATNMCSQVMCKTNLKPTPQGFIPGFW